MLKELRISKGISASFVAKKLGISRDTVRNMETGRTSPKLDWIPTLSFLYGISIEELINGYLKEKKEKEERENDKNITRPNK